MLWILAGCIWVVALSGRPGSQPRSIEKSKRYVHVIYQNRFGDEMYCSAVAVAPHALLTASHCEAPTNRLTIDGISGYHIDSVIRDEYDHSIYLIKDASFDDYTPLVTRAPSESTPVFVWGNPEMVMFVLYKGHKLRSVSMLGTVVTVFNFAGKVGDSGSGVFTEDGDLVGVVSRLEDYIDSNGKEQKGLATLPIKFTDAELQKAANFK